MASITISEATSVTQAQFIDCLTDFGPDRATFWPNSQGSYLTVHGLGKTWADVTEGSNIFGGVWERLHYDWSNPNRVLLRTTDSNIWTSRSSWRYSFKTISNEQTIITYTIERFPRNMRARMIMIFVGLVGKRLIRRDFKQTLQAMEASLATAE